VSRADILWARVTESDDEPVERIALSGASKQAHVSVICA
jgi:hypothetical protein